MKIIALANDEQWQELTNSQSEINWERIKNIDAFSNTENVTAFFYLAAMENISSLADIKVPVFINTVDVTLKELDTPLNIYRINAWPGFLARSLWEITGSPNDMISGLFASLNKKIAFVADQPGMVAARIISMIINEAYFALEDNVSSKDEIDTAMKLGTNYPFGPFEWTKKIGIENIASLLLKLSTTDNRYQPSALLMHEAQIK